ncbi:MAG TPA: indole-3-glycerol phosphate synthase TrpC, partial [Vicinamibacterales bacterium]|nr:indole-3-glycerol phosphate synthase TrpC [Vicinamibacterales bacterium]
MTAGGRLGNGGGLLDAIAASVRATVAGRRARVPIDVLAGVADCARPDARRFRDAIGRPGRANIIAECKRRSPARGVLARVYAPADLAHSYERHGAAAISVLTEPTFFDGDLAHLEAVRSATALPVLRKDFIVTSYQLWEAKAYGADMILLIVAALEQSALVSLIERTQSLGMTALVEVHDEAEI